MTTSWKPEIIADSSGQWGTIADSDSSGRWGACGSLRFATAHEAEEYVQNLKQRWTVVRDTRVTQSDDPVTAVWTDDGLVHLPRLPNKST
jgi:hypothetical protein